MPDLPANFPFGRSPLPPRVLVTGANGLLGQALVKRLVDEEVAVTATARDDTLRPAVGCDYRPMDVTVPNAVTAAFEAVEPDVVVNCAAMSDVAACDDDRNRAWATNARAVKRLAKRCKEHRAHLIQVSTDFVFNGKRGPYDEEARPDPVNYYGRTKLAAENALREVGVPNWTIVRTVLLYGTGTDLSRPNIVQWMMKQLAAGETIHVVTDQHRTPTYVPDLADGIARIIERDATGIYHMSGRETATIHELADTVADVLGFDPALIDPVPSSYFNDAVERPKKTGFLILKAESELGYDPHSLQTGLRATGRALGLDPDS